MFNLLWGNALLNEKYCWVTIFMMRVYIKGVKAHYSGLFGSHSGILFR